MEKNNFKLMLIIIGIILFILSMCLDDILRKIYLITIGWIIILISWLIEKNE